MAQRADTARPTGSGIVTSAPAPGTRKPEKVIRLQDTVIQGRIQKPAAFFVLGRAPLSFEEPEPRGSFVPRIFRSIEKPPF